MAENSKIAWTTHTFNPWIGCQKVSPGCDGCYAEALMDHRYHKVQWGPHGERKRTSESYWKQPVRWAKAVRESGVLFRPRVFCASLADVFDNQVPREWRGDLWDTIYATRELDWLILTKRPENIRSMLPTSWGGGWTNVWLGVTAEDQAHFDRRWNILSKIPAAVRFVSYEPAIGPLSDISADDGVTAPDWLICGGESGANWRPMDLSWARTAQGLCEIHGTKFFMKQLAGRNPLKEIADFPTSLRIREFPEAR